MPSKNPKLTILSDDKEPWHRQPKEHERAYAAFRVYLDMEKRSIRTSVPDVREDTLLTWAKSYRWAVRALAYDQYLAREADTARRKSIHKANRLSERKRIEDKERAHKIADLIGEKIEIIAGWPMERMVRRSESVDGRYEIVEPLRVSIRDLKDLSKAYTDMRRYAFDLDPASVERDDHGDEDEGGLSQAQVNAALAAMANEAMREMGPADTGT